MATRIDFSDFTVYDRFELDDAGDSWDNIRGRVGLDSETLWGNFYGLVATVEGDSVNSKYEGWERGFYTVDTTGMSASRARIYFDLSELYNDWSFDWNIGLYAWSPDTPGELKSADWDNISISPAAVVPYHETAYTIPAGTGFDLTGYGYIELNSTFLAAVGGAINFACVLVRDATDSEPAWEWAEVLVTCGDTQSYLVLDYGINWNGVEVPEWNGVTTDVFNGVSA